MAYNTKPIVTDKDGNPISQYYNPTTDSYEPVEGSGGGNKVVLYNADGTENNELSLISILDKLSQLTGTVIDEETRKSNELQRIEFYNQLQQMLIDGDLKGDKGDIGLTGEGLEFDWLDTQLGVRVEGQTEYVYVDLKGEKGETGDMENLNAQHIEDALGYVPASQADLDNIDISSQIETHNTAENQHENIIGLLSNLTTDEKANLVSAINEVKAQSNEIEYSELSSVATNIGNDGLYKNIEWTRKDLTIYAKSELIGISPYVQIKVDYYNKLGTEIEKSITWDIHYDSNDFPYKREVV